MPTTDAVNGDVKVSLPEKFITKIGEKAYKFLSFVDPDDLDYQKEMMTAAAIKEDVNLMKQRRRVSLILKSGHFRKELEEIIRSYGQTADYPGLSTSLLSLQHVTELFTSAPIGPAPNVVGLNKGMLIIFLKYCIEI